MGKKNHSRSTTPVPQKSTPETATVKANPTPSAYYDAFKYINGMFRLSRFCVCLILRIIVGYAMFLVYPAFYTAATFLVAFIYQRKWTFEFVLPFFKSFVDSKDEISFEKLPFLILGILFFNTYWLSGWFSLTSQAFHSIGLDNNNPRENRAKLTGLAARLLATHQNCVESSSLILAAVVIPCLAKLDLSVHLNFLLMVLVAR
ncbi:hypothetical protein HDU92_005494 [Lobulomyces angularis]|nr:hypothetical protein HDU92_005494 [Lobulomyces angularis]